MNRVFLLQICKLQIALLCVALQKFFAEIMQTAKQAIYLFHKILAILETSGSPTFLGCDPLSKTTNRLILNLPLWICRYGQHLRAVKSWTEIVILKSSVIESQLTCSPKNFR
ncbi:hypothetical protein T02_5057 [Trichinella nativa]|uniref:Secreted protein n=1 Tax=Trichinella nativa TaxID=6335 RepID=A0A0V1L1T5_9BILA|nr:hypothetical protein T02_5057 [Trichinella nativa]